jgi:hypothetical protein
MALTSPGVEVTIIDESQYIPAATNSVPYILIATAQNKISGAGVGVAAGTLAVNANKTYLISSQRDLSATFGVPFFYSTTVGTPINGYELNEYGLLAAHSALGISNRCYVQRVDIDLAELTATLVRPTGEPNNNTYWLDTANTLWGIFEWNQVTSAFTNKIPTVLTDTADLEPSTTIPLQSIGSIGDYAITSGLDVSNPADSSIYTWEYYKRGGPFTTEAPNWLQDGLTASQLYNTWVQIGSDQWKTSWPTVSGTLAPTSLTPLDSFAINGTTFVVPVEGTVLSVASLINSYETPGIFAAAIGGKLFIYADSLATGDGSTEGGIGIVDISNVNGTPLTALGITPNTYYAPVYQASPSYTVPRWRTTDTIPEPTGSIWQKISNVNLGLNTVIKKYNSTLGTFVQQSCPAYTTEPAANYALDPSGGGQNIPAGATYIRVDPHNDATADLLILERYATGPTIITGSTVPTSFVVGNTFQIASTQVGTAALSPTITAVIRGTGTVADFINAVSAANVPYVSATVNSAGNIVMTHSEGGSISLTNIIGTPITTAGFNTTVLGIRPAYTGNVAAGLWLSNWISAPDWTYTASSTAPDQDPADGRLWYYSATDQVDIMIQDDGIWQGYQNVTNDVRGDDLTLTNATGPIISATAPTTQTDTSASPLAYGDLWIDISDLENYPVISRWTNVNGANQWVQLDNTDQTTENGVLFTDARWAPNGTTDPITDPFPTIVSLLTSDYLDLDAPDPSLFPQGMLLFNTRRSGFNVKSFQVDYFNSTTFPDDTLPAVTNAWVTVSGNRDNGSPYMGRQAQRSLIVQALKAGIDTSTSAREEQRVFNLIACTQYPELVPNMIALNNERNNTAFVVADTPLRLTPDEIITWATNADGEGLATADGQIAGDQYSGVFYPSCQTTDLSGSPVVTAPSHMMLRTIIRSDEVAYPWLAPAGTRRGVVDNATQIGYINAATGEFESIGVRQGLRDVLYENRINPITFIPGVGITNFGNKTTTSITSSMDRINVARLVAFIRGRLDVIGKQFLFEPNDQITRNEITNAIDSLMIDLIAKRGIYDYLIVCDLTNNTPARIDRNELYVDIAIEPVKAVEFIYIPVRIKNTGEISGTAS